MKRLAVGLLVLASATAAFALDDSMPRPGARIGILEMADRHANGSERGVTSTIRRDLRAELREDGYDAFDARTTYDALSRNAEGNADYYVEIVSGNSQGEQTGAVDVAVKNVGVQVSAVTSHVAAELRLYDGHTLELVRSFDLSREKTVIVPTALAIGSSHISAWIPLPFVRYAQARAAAHEVAKAAAGHIAGRDQNEKPEEKRPD